MTTRIQKSLCNLNNLIDAQHQKLCDELRKYKLSHKKLCVLVSQFEKFLNKYELDDLYKTDEEYQEDVAFLRDRIFRRLNYF